MSDKLNVTTGCKITVDGFPHLKSQKDVESFYEDLRRISFVYQCEVEIVEEVDYTPYIMGSLFTTIPIAIVAVGIGLRRILKRRKEIKND